MQIPIAKFQIQVQKEPQIQIKIQMHIQIYNYTYVLEKGQTGRKFFLSADSNIKVAGFQRRPMATDVGHQVARTAAESESVKVVESES